MINSTAIKQPVPVRKLPKSQLTPEELECIKLRNIHTQMIYRCNKLAHRNYPNYGGRGIKVCDRWQGKGGFQRFVSDMGDRPEGHQIDRRENDGDYCPKNCRWVSRADNQRNTRRTRWIDLGDGSRLSLPAMAEALKLPRKCFQQRLDNGWTIAESILGDRIGEDESDS